MHPELYLVIYRQAERELERDLALLVTMRDRPQHVVPRGGPGLRAEVEVLLAWARSALASRRAAPQAMCCPAPA